jgi:NADH dehydrogenase
MAARVIIVGGGFGGLTVARGLGSKKGVEVEIFDRRNYHLFQPLLYQVSMAGLSPAEIAVPIRGELSGYSNIETWLGGVKSVDLAGKKIGTDWGLEFNYDYLVLACGAKHSYFGHESWEAFAPGLKTVEQATEIRRRVFTAFEMAERETDKERQRHLLTFVVIGGGPTGVELAGALGEISRFTLTHDFRRIDPQRTRIILVEGGPRILPSFDPSLSARASRDLENLGVQVWTSSMVSNISKEGVEIGKEVLKAATILWAAGVKPSSLNQTLGIPLDRLGRVIVEEDLSLTGHPEVFVIGDQAHFSHGVSEALPGLATVAMQQGRHVTKNILSDLKGRQRKPFRYINKGIMATIGRRRAVVQLPGIRFGGPLAWFMWFLVHIYYLVGFKNKLVVYISWMWSYLTYRRGARLIVEKDWRFYRDDGRTVSDEKT